MKHLLIASALCLAFTSFAQKDKEDAKFFYKETTIETDDYKIYIVDAVSNIKQSKFKIKIFNKTNDYLLIKPSEFKYTSGDKVLLGKDRTYVVSPNEEESAVIDFRGADMLAEKYSVELKGIYKASAGGKAHAIPNFVLPATKNDFTVENITCSLKKADLKTDKSVVKFECAYVGDGVEIINPSKVVALMSGGQDNPNTKKGQSIILERGKRDDFTLVFPEIKDGGDMQKKGLQVKWNESFRESKLLPIGNSKIDMERDATKK